MIGLYKAIRDFNPEKSSSFKAFAEICVTRQIITAIKTATRQKHIPLNTYVSLNKPIYEEESERTLLDVLSGLKISDPEELIISKEQMKYHRRKNYKSLIRIGNRSINSYLDGKSYQEIACDLERHSKSIDNALQRVKRKLEKCLNSKVIIYIDKQKKLIVNFIIGISRNRYDLKRSHSSVGRASPW